MKITRENYEIWFLDYLEGNLDQERKSEVHRFMIQNPDLAEEFEALSPALQQDFSVYFPEKDALKRESFDDSEYFETAAIAAMEGDLSEEERGQFENWLKKNPDKRSFLSDLSATKLYPDLREKFPGKDGLKRRNFGIILWTRIVPLAAAILLALLLFNPLKKTEPNLNLTSEIVVPPKVGSTSAVAAIAESAIAGNLKSSPPSTKKRSVGKAKKQIPPSRIDRQFDSVGSLQPRVTAVNSSLPVFADLALVPVKDPVYAVTNRVPLTEFFKNKLQSLKDKSPKGFYTREEVTIAGLRLFSRLPGNHLTGKKGKDGKLQSIYFDTKLLAISIPVNR